LIDSIFVGETKTIKHDIPTDSETAKNMMKTTNFITLPDGRRLAYAEFGKPDGHPVIYFHGGVSSRLEPLLLGNELISQYGLRLVVPDRPGMGQSDFQPDRGFSDFPKDVVFLADMLGLDKFSVMGVSSGSGYVYACAAKIPDRLLAAVAVSGAWDTDSLKDLPLFSRWSYSVAKIFPLFYRGMLKLLLRSYQGSPEKLLASFKKQLSAVDYAVFDSPQRLQAARDWTIEAMRQGTKGITWDTLLYVHPWDFDVAEIQIPITFFHGEQDQSILIAMAKKAISRLPTAKLFAYPNEGHLSVVINQFEEIVRALKNEVDIQTTHVAAKP
jgi:pimeloyl-ACP methyl ester carboxylesterase